MTKNITELFLSSGKQTLKTANFTLTAEEQKLIILAMIESGKDMDDKNKTIADNVFCKFIGVEKSPAQQSKVIALFPER